MSKYLYEGSSVLLQLSKLGFIDDSTHAIIKTDLQLHPNVFEKMTPKD